MKLINRKRLADKYFIMGILVLLVLLFVSWAFESPLVEILCMDYSASDLAPDAMEIMLRQIMTWEMYIDSSMRYVVNIFPVFASLTVVPFLRERESYLVYGANRFGTAEKWTLGKTVLLYALRGGLATAMAFAIFFIAGSFFLKTSITDIGGFASALPEGFYTSHPLGFFLFLDFGVYLWIGTAFAAIGCAVALLSNTAIFVLAIPLLLYVLESYIGMFTGLLPFQISESVCAFNTLYSTWEILVPVAVVLAFSVALNVFAVKKRMKLIDG